MLTETILCLACPPARRGGKFLHAHAWSPCLENLATHPAIWPTILELTDGKPKLVSTSACRRLLSRAGKRVLRPMAVLLLQLHESGTLFWEDSRRNDLGDTYDPDRDIHVSVAGTDGVHLHCGREVRCPGHTLLLVSQVRVFAASRLCHLT